MKHQQTHLQILLEQALKRKHDTRSYGRQTHGIKNGIETHERKDAELDHTSGEVIEKLRFMQLQRSEF